jgi:hypothetical protein
MRVLVLESDRHSADRSIAALQEAGHEVVRCHEHGMPAFPCNALCDGGTCPLETEEGVDVVLDWRAHPYPWPTAFEDGTSCAARRCIPIVVAGAVEFNPFDKWTTVVANQESVVETCERAATEPIESIAVAARRKVRQLLARDPLVAEATDVIVTRKAGGLEAVVVLPEEADEVEAALAVGVAGAVRTRDRWTPRVDVCVRRVQAPGTAGPSPSSV